MQIWKRAAPCIRGLAISSASLFWWLSADSRFPQTPYEQRQASDLQSPARLYSREAVAQSGGGGCSAAGVENLAIDAKIQATETHTQGLPRAGCFAPWRSAESSRARLASTLLGRERYPDAPRKGSPL
jgi:hypothetical protein